jgi:hypothetical protein
MYKCSPRAGGRAGGRKIWRGRGVGWCEIGSTDRLRGTAARRWSAGERRRRAAFIGGQEGFGGKSTEPCLARLTQAVPCRAGPAHLARFGIRLAFSDFYQFINSIKNARACKYWTYSLLHGYLYLYHDIYLFLTNTSCFSICLQITREIYIYPLMHHVFHQFILWFNPAWHAHSTLNQIFLLIKTETSLDFEIKKKEQKNNSRPS